jgi:hypothetical protein
MLTHVCSRVNVGRGKRLLVPRNLAWKCCALRQAGGLRRVSG